MSSRRVTVVDYGLGNLRSVSEALRKIGADAHISSDPDYIAKSSQLILPGVGAFGVAVASLSGYNLKEAVVRSALSGAPLLGICLGMQLLFNQSSEFGQSEGLGLIPGVVSEIRSPKDASSGVKKTHIGWRTLDLTTSGNSSRLLANCDPQDSFYFVHSFSGNPSESSDSLATVAFGNQTIVAAAFRENVFGVQFHPEKSGLAGLRLLEAFIEL